MSKLISIPIRIEFEKLKEVKSQEGLDYLSALWVGRIIGPKEVLRLQFYFHVLPVTKHLDDYILDQYSEEKKRLGFTKTWQKCGKTEQYIFYYKKDRTYISQLGCSVHDLSDRPGDCKAVEWLP